MEDEQSAICRNAAFNWLSRHAERGDDMFSRESLERGFPFQDDYVCLVGPAGIFKPRQIRYYPLSITTTTTGPYSDSFDSSGNFLLYSYRGTNPNHHDNRRLRDAMKDNIPLVYFYGTVPGLYLTVYPIFVVNDDPRRLTFTVSADDVTQLSYERDDADDAIRRQYVTRLVRHRMHQRSFRDRVLRAYRERCSICRLKHADLLDAAHITADADDAGEPVVSNGLSLCKIHHAAFDRDYFGIKPDYRIVVRPSIMEERDGPMLTAGLQAIDKLKLIVPRSARHRPDTDRLRLRFEAFADKAL